MTVKHATASTFVFCRFPDGWRLGLIEHPLLGRHTNPGGHVEAGETPVQAALREAGEETGLTVRLVEPSGQPWQVRDFDVRADNSLAGPHVHVDHQYVVVADDPTPVGIPAHPFAWYRPEQLAELVMFDSTRSAVAVLFPRIDELATGRLEPAAVPPPDPVSA